MKKMITRRNFLKALAFLPLLWAWLPAAVPVRLLPLRPPPVPLRHRRCFRLDLGAQGHAGLPLGRRRRC